MLYLEVNEREEIQADYIEEIRLKLQSAYAQAKHLDNATLQSVADKIGVNRSAVHRNLSGECNLTSKTIADLAWALGKRPRFALEDIHAHKVHTSTNFDDAIQKIINRTNSVISLDKTVFIGANDFSPTNPMCSLQVA